MRLAPTIARSVLTACAAPALALCAASETSAGLSLGVAPFLGIDAAEEPTVGTPEKKEAAEGGIRDNSFFIEEAYNQEPGVVQHISNLVWTRDDEDGVERVAIDFVFTQEWPLGSQAHQFSYTVPLVWFEEEPDEGSREREGDVGDIFLNYRYQVADGSRGFAFAPRLSLILPTGDEEKGIGVGEVGVFTNLPFSFECESFAFHVNAGASAHSGVTTDLPGGGTSPERSLRAFNLGASAIWIDSPVVQPLIETFALFDQEIGDDGETHDMTKVIVSPGVRWAPYTSGSSQVVVGAALPIGVTDDAPDYGLFLYLSIEHPF